MREIRFLPKECDDDNTYLWSALNFKHLMQHALVLVFSDPRLDTLNNHIQEDDKEDQQVPKVLRFVYRYNETVSFHKHCQSQQACNHFKFESSFNPDAWAEQRCLLIHWIWLRQCWTPRLRQILCHHWSIKKSSLDNFVILTPILLPINCSFLKF